MNSKCNCFEIFVKFIATSFNIGDVGGIWFLYLSDLNIENFRKTLSDNMSYGCCVKCFDKFLLVTILALP